mmetsp:Transcript_2814/g.10452  ORF Transcript_2814/g.10452 Transcript_2814/m.10452 type:complete len:455 (-) Transcript_2814:195-1559(-)
MPERENRPLQPTVGLSSRRVLPVRQSFRQDFHGPRRRGQRHRVRRLQQGGIQRRGGRQAQNLGFQRRAGHREGQERRQKGGPDDPRGDPARQDCQAGKPQAQLAACAGGCWRWRRRCAGGEARPGRAGNLRVRHLGQKGRQAAEQQEEVSAARAQARRLCERLGVLPGRKVAADLRLGPADRDLGRPRLSGPAGSEGPGRILLRQPEPEPREDDACHGSRGLQGHLPVEQRPGEPPWHEPGPLPLLEGGARGPSHAGPTAGHGRRCDGGGRRRQRRRRRGSAGRAHGCGRGRVGLPRPRHPLGSPQEPLARIDVPGRDQGEKQAQGAGEQAGEGSLLPADRVVDEGDLVGPGRRGGRRGRGRGGGRQGVVQNRQGCRRWGDGFGPDLCARFGGPRRGHRKPQDPLPGADLHGDLCPGPRRRAGRPRILRPPHRDEDGLRAPAGGAQHGAQGAHG